MPFNKLAHNFNVFTDDEANRINISQQLDSGDFHVVYIDKEQVGLLVKWLQEAQESLSSSDGNEN